MKEFYCFNGKFKFHFESIFHYDSNSPLVIISFHFAFPISLFYLFSIQISCLGSGQHRVLDAISECEQHGKNLGMRESSTAWRVFFRKEFMAPWYDPTRDPICTDLVYQQVKRGITMGEYRLDKVSSC